MQSLGKMNIGFFVETHQPGVGLFHIIDQIARHLVSSANVIVVTSTLKDKKIVDDYPYSVVRHHILKVPWLNIELPLSFLDFKFNRLLHDLKLDVVHIHSGHIIGQMGIQHAKKHQIPLIGSIHGFVDFNTWNPLTEETYTEKDIKEIKNTYQFCQLVFSDQGSNENVLDLGQRQIKPVILPFGTNFVFVDNDHSIQELRQKHNIKTDESIVLSIHTSPEPSNIVWIADALFKLRLRGYKFRWIILDASNDDQVLMTRLKKNGLMPYVLLVNSDHSDLIYKEYIKMSDLVLHASLSDPFSTAIINAASQKKPVLCIEETKIASQIIDGTNGFFAKPTPTDYAEKIIELLKYPKVLKKVGDKAYRDFYRSWKDVASFYMQAYHQVKQPLEQTT